MSVQLFIVVSLEMIFSSFLQLWLENWNHPNYFYLILHIMIFKAYHHNFPLSSRIQQMST